MGMSQEKLGHALGLTFQQVQKYEKGTNRIGASRLQEIAIILKVPISFFYEEQSSPDAVTSQGLLDLLGRRDALELLKAYSRITSPKLRRAILEVARAAAPEEKC